MTRRLLQTFAVVAGLAAAGFGQGACKTDVAMSTASIQGNTVLTPAPYATIYACALGATGTPCSPQIQLYTDATLSTTRGQPVTADVYGNFTLCAPPGAVYLQETFGGTTLNTPNYSIPAQSGGTTNVVDAYLQPGADLCAKINAAEAISGNVNAQGFTANQTVSTTCTLSRPGTVVLPAVKITCNVTPCFKITVPSVRLLGVGNWNRYNVGAHTWIFMGVAGIAIDHESLNANGLLLENLDIDGNSKTATIGVFNTEPGENRYRNLLVHDFSRWCLYAPSNLNDYETIQTQGCGKDGIIIGTDEEVHGTTESFNNTGDGLRIIGPSSGVVGSQFDFNGGYGIHADATFPSDFQTSHAYLLGDYIRPITGNCATGNNSLSYPNGMTFVVTTAGTSGGSAPSWCTGGVGQIGTYITNGGATFQVQNWPNNGEFYVTITGNRVNDNNGANIQLDGLNSLNLLGANVSGNTVGQASNSGNAAAGIICNYCAGFSFTGNTWYGSGGGAKNDLGGILLNNSFNGTIAGFSAFQSHKNAIKLTATNYTTISGFTGASNADSTTAAADAYNIYLDASSVENNLSGITVQAGTYSKGIFNAGGCTNLLNGYNNNLGAGLDSFNCTKGTYRTTNNYTQTVPETAGAAMLDPTQSFVIDSLDSTNSNYGAWTHTWNYNQFFGGNAIFGSAGNISIVNDGTTGTTLKLLAKENGSAQAIKVGTSDTAVPIYVVTGGAGTGGYAVLSTVGRATCTTDAGGATVSHWLGASTSTAGRCADLGSVVPPGRCYVGISLNTVGANADTSVLVLQGCSPANPTTNTGSAIYASKRGVAGCTTAASIGGVCSTPITVTWPAAFADTNYSVSCSPSGAPTNLPGAPYISAKSTTTVTVNYFAITAAAASWATIDCDATHD